MVVGCLWVWSWQEAGSFGDFVGGLGAVGALGFVAREYIKRGDEERKREARQIEVRAMNQRLLCAFNKGDRYIDRTAWHLPFRPEGERLVWVYAVDYPQGGAITSGFQSDRNVIEAKAGEELCLEKGETSDGCSLIFRDSGWRWWRAGVDGSLSEYRPSERVKAGPPPEDAPSKRGKQKPVG